MKYLICFCAPMALFYVVHVIKYPTATLRAITFRENYRSAFVAWLEAMSFGITVSWLVFKLH